MSNKTMHATSLAAPRMMVTVRIQKMKKALLIICLFAAQRGTPCHAGTNSLWDVVLPPLNYSNATIGSVIRDLEALSQQHDPDHRGVRIVCPSYGRITITSRTNMTIREVVSVLALSGESGFADDVALVFERPTTGPPVYRLAGIHGSVVDMVTGHPITNAVIATDFVSDKVSVDSNRTIHLSSSFSTNEFVISADGRGKRCSTSPLRFCTIDERGGFFAVVPYFVRRPRLYGLVLHQGKDDTLNLAVSAPGYLDSKLEVVVDDDMIAPILVKLERRKVEF